MTEAASLTIIVQRMAEAAAWCCCCWSDVTIQNQSLTSVWPWLRVVVIIQYTRTGTAVSVRNNPTTAGLNTRVEIATRSETHPLHHSYWAKSQRVLGSKAKLGCAEMTTTWRDFVVCIAAYTPKTRFRSWLPWRPHLRHETKTFIVSPSKSTVNV